jgi:putative addiction module killer protein
VTQLSPKLRKTAEFHEWYQSLEDTLRTRIDARLDMVKAGNFGASRALGDGLFELKWKNGMRVYYSRRRIGHIDAIIVWGGFKAKQKQDIKKARTIKARYENELETKIS